MKLLIILVATLVVGLLVGCAPSDALPAPRNEAKPGATSPEHAGDQEIAQNVYAELLRNIPDTPGAISSIYINNYTLARELFGIHLPGPKAGGDEILDYATLLLGTGLEDGPWISGFHDNAPTFLENGRYLAFSIRDIDQSILAAPKPLLEVVRGRFNPGATHRALRACSECPQGQRMEHNGIQFYSWGEDNRGGIRLKFSPPAFDHLGRGGRIAVQDDYVFRTIETAAMMALIDASQDDRSSLADREDFQLLASALSDLDVYSAFLSGDVPQLQETIRLSEAPANQQVPPLLPYVAYATGAGRDQKGDFMAIVLVHTDSAAADANADRLLSRVEETTMVFQQKPWSTLVTVDDVEIRSEGNVLIAKLPFNSETSPSIWSQLVPTADQLLLHE